MFKTFEVISKDDVIFNDEEEEDLLKQLGNKSRVINLNESYKQMSLNDMKLLLFVLNEKMNKILDVIDEEKIDSIHKKLENLLNLLKEYE